LAGTRKPGSLRLNGEGDPVDEGTTSRLASPRPGSAGLSHAPNKPKLHPGRTSAPAGLVLRFGNHGSNVRTLQTLLNIRLDPSPKLQVDGYFGPDTLRAVRRFQVAGNMPEDGVAGKLTWYHLIAAKTATPVNITVRVSPPGVAAWSLTQKAEEVVRRLPGKLPSELWAQLRGLASPDSLVMFVALFAASQLFGAGELIGVGILLVLGEQVFFELVHAVQLTVLASTESELDEAATHLAGAIVTVGAVLFAAALAKFFGSGKSQPKEPASTEPEYRPPSTGKTADAPQGSAQGESPPPQVLSPNKLPVSLPKNPEEMLEHGYNETSHPSAAESGHRTFENPETGDKLRFDKGDPDAPPKSHAANDHYHRENPNATGKRDAYLDSDGKPCPRNSDESHLYPEEED
jgi:hypothetical protein